MSSTLFNERLSAQQPAQPVHARTGAVIDRTVLHLTSDAVVKQHDVDTATGTRSLQTRLHVEAWVRNTSYEKSVWLDVHVFDRDTSLAHRETVPLHYAHAAGDAGDIFVFDGMVYQGAAVPPGTEEPSPDARALAYRVYCELDARLFTDGVVHWSDVRADARSGSK